MKPGGKKRRNKFTMKLYEWQIQETLFCIVAFTFHFYSSEFKYYTNNPNQFINICDGNY